MWAGVVFVLLAGVPACRGAGYSAYQYYETGRSSDNADFYDSYNEDVPVTPEITTVVEVLTRIKRYGEQDEIRTLNPEEIQDVRGALSKILGGHKPESLSAQVPREYTDIYDYVDKSNINLPETRNFTDFEGHKVVRKWSPEGEDRLSVGVQHWEPTIEVKHWSPTVDVQRWSPTVDVQRWSPTVDVQRWSPTVDVQRWSPTEEGERWSLTNEGQRWNPVEFITRTSVDERQPTLKVQQWSPTVDVQHWSPNDDIQETTKLEDVSSTISNKDIQAEVRDMFPLREGMEVVPRRSSPFHVQKWSPGDDSQDTLQKSSAYSNDIEAEVRKMIPIRDDLAVVPMGQPASPVDVQHWSPTIDVQNWSPFADTQEILETNTYSNEEIRKDVQNLMPSESVLFEDWTDTITVQHWSWVPTITPKYWSPVDGDEETLPITTPTSDPYIMMETSVERDIAAFITVPDILTADGLPVLRQSNNDTTPSPATTSTTTTTSPAPTTTSTTTTPAPTTTTTTTTPAPTTTVPLTTTMPPTTTSTKRSPRMDINAIIAIIANLTYDYEWNLTEEFNKTLIEHGVPTCPTGTTLSTTSTTPSPYDFANTSVVGKCFVCGLKTTEIPRNAFCADAFAGDFLPLVPIDPRARGQIASYRKYCRHLDVHNYVENPSEPRSIYGRFTGGCGVRWTDLTGIYTQRTCRARFRPLMGKHFASKRMAKLELALINVENGCIISPMATLLPLSRGVSLYARFHACVCTGSWCNRAARSAPARPGLYTCVLAGWLARYT